MRTLNVFKPAFVSVIYFYLGLFAFPYLAQAQSTGTAAPSIIITSPKAGTNIVLGEICHITWTSQNVSTVDVGYSFGPGSLNWMDNNASVNIPNKGYYDWKVNIGNTTNTKIMIYVNGSYSGYVNVVDPASAILQSPAPNSSVTTPMVSFSWTPATGATGYSLKVGSTANGDEYGSSGQTTSTSTSLIIPQNGQKVYVTLSTLVKGVWKVNQYTFKMATPMITITSPRAGSNLVPGQTYHITWTNSKNINVVTLGYSFGPGSLNWMDNNASVNIPNKG